MAREGRITRGGASRERKHCGRHQDGALEGREEKPCQLKKKTPPNKTKQKKKKKKQKADYSISDPPRMKRKQGRGKKKSPLGGHEEPRDSRL